MSIYSIALSGLMAQSAVIGVHAQNIANASVTGKPNAQAGERHAYAPIDPVTISVSGGGVAASLIPVDPPHVTFYDPSSSDSDANGLVAAPNIMLEEEIIGLNVAKNSYIANAKLIAVQRDMDDALLDIFT